MVESNIQSATTLRDGSLTATRTSILVEGRRCCCRLDLISAIHDAASEVASTRTRFDHFFKALDCAER